MAPPVAPSGIAKSARVMFEPSQTPSAPVASEIAVGIAAALLYAIAFTVELLVGLAAYFGGEAKA